MTHNIPESVKSTVPNPETPLWRKLIKYSPYIAKHKWFVFLEACKLGIPLRGFFHDMDKLRLDELLPYSHRFGGPLGIKYGRDKTGQYSASNCGDFSFEMALFLHICRNDHHWQFWIRVEPNGSTYAMPMCEGAWKEMVADWRGASRAQGGTGSALDWYKANKDKLILNPETRALCEKEIGYTP